MNRSIEIHLFDNVIYTALFTYTFLAQRIEGTVRSKIKHAIKLKTSPARLAQQLQPY